MNRPTYNCTCASHLRLDRFVALSLCGMALAACSLVRSEGSHVDSETHFLTACQDTCPGSFECICGVCSVTCDPASDCSETHSQASCLSATDFSGGASCVEGNPSVCDVTCEQDSDCQTISSQHQCIQGHCRAAVSNGGGCDYGGTHYNEGDSFDSTDGCNSCSCGTQGQVACTERACAPGGGCDYGGVHYNEGDGFPSTDGCNACGCMAGGEVICTTADCLADAGVPCADGDTKLAEDGCNTCTCGNGLWSCTEKFCVSDAGTSDAAILCTDGDMKTVDNGCNTCTCMGGLWSCTTAACAQCPAPVEGNQNCATVIVYAKDPATSLCCEYSSPCAAPVDWAQYYTSAECAAAAN